MRRARALALLFALSSASACDVQGTYVDRSGNIATLKVAPSGAIAATSFSGTRWSKCSGGVIDDTHIFLAFHGAADNETGTFASNCSALIWPGAAPSVWGKVGSYLYGAAPAGDGVVVTDVHMVFMSHLDLGYTDLARNVCDYYFESNLLGNAALALALANTSTPYALTSHAFLIAEFLDGAAGCAHARPPPAATAAVDAAIRAGHIRWHAQSANYNTALLDAASFAAQVAEADALNARYNKSWGSALMKSTDVPGLTRSVVPRLAALGRTAVHTGGNAKCALARVPQAFMWAHPETGTALLALATNNYGGNLVVPPHALIINVRSTRATPRPPAAPATATLTTPKPIPFRAPRP